MDAPCETGDLRHDVVEDEKQLAQACQTREIASARLYLSVGAEHHEEANRRSLHARDSC